MKEAAGHKKGAWFWIGVVCLSLSALLWITILTILFIESVTLYEAGGVMILVILATFVPIIVGIYCVRRGIRGEELERESLIQRILKKASLIAILFLALGFLISGIVLLLAVHNWLWGSICAGMAIIFFWISNKFR